MSCPGQAECPDWMQVTHWDSHTHTPILRTDRKWSEKEKTSVQTVKDCQSFAEAAAWPAGTLRDAPVRWKESRESAQVSLTSSRWSILHTEPAHCRRTSHLFNWRPRCLVAVALPASAALLDVVVLFLTRPLNFLLQSALRCCQESGCLINSVVFKKNLCTYKSSWRAHGIKTIQCHQFQSGWLHESICFNNIDP